MRSEQARSTEAAPTPSTRGLARPTSMPRWPAWSTDSCSQSAAPGSAAWATRSWLRLPLPVSSSGPTASRQATSMPTRTGAAQER